MNIKNTAIKRIIADVRELERHPSSRYHAAPLEENLFEWHFTIRGPSGSDFDGGLYHGRIILAADYPFKPPNIVFLTKNGRFEVGTKICLSISAHHEESWQPAWGVRTMLEAIISFLPSEGAGAIGALDWTKEERQKLVKESHSFCCSVCGSISTLIKQTEDQEEAGKASGDTDITNDAATDEIAAAVRQLSMRAPSSSSRTSDRGAPDTPKGGPSAAAIEAARLPPTPSPLKEPSSPVSMPKEGNNGYTNSSSERATTTTAIAISTTAPPRDGTSNASQNNLHLASLSDPDDIVGDGDGLFFSLNPTAAAGETPQLPPGSSLDGPPGTPPSLRALRRRVLAGRRSNTSSPSILTAGTTAPAGGVDIEDSSSGVFGAGRQDTADTAASTASTFEAASAPCAGVVGSDYTADTEVGMRRRRETDREDGVRTTEDMTNAADADGIVVVSPPSNDFIDIVLIVLLVVVAFVIVILLSRKMIRKYNSFDF